MFSQYIRVQMMFLCGFPCDRHGFVNCTPWFGVDHERNVYITLRLGYQCLPKHARFYSISRICFWKHCTFSDRFCGSIKAIDLLSRVFRFLCFAVCSFGGAAMVDTVASAEALAHCTIINGSLEIQVGQGGELTLKPRATSPLSRERCFRALSWPMWCSFILVMLAVM